MSSHLLGLTINSGLFQVALSAHIVCAVAGFGGMMGQRIRHGGDSPARDSRTGPAHTSPVLEGLVAGVLVFGVLAVMLDDRFDFSQLWLTLGFGFYGLWQALWFSVLRPPRNPTPRMRGLAHAASDLLLAATVFVMVAKPGGLG